MLIEIYTKDGCPECNRAKKVLANFGYSFREFRLGENITRDEVKAKFPNAKYVPIIVVDDVQKSVEDMQLLLEGSTKV